MLITCHIFKRTNGKLIYMSESFFVIIFMLVFCKSRKLQTFCFPIPEYLATENYTLNLLFLSYLYHITYILICKCSTYFYVKFRFIHTLCNAVFAVCLLQHPCLKINAENNWQSSMDANRISIKYI